MTKYLCTKAQPVPRSYADGEYAYSYDFDGAEAVDTKDAEEAAIEYYFADIDDSMELQSTPAFVAVCPVKSPGVVDVFEVERVFKTRKVKIVEDKK